MTRNDGLHNSVSVTNGTHIGNVIGAGEVDSHAKVRIGNVGSGDGQPPGTVADLRSMIEAARGQIVGVAASEKERVELAYELRKILEALEADEPKPEPVRERWQSIQRVLGALAGSGAIAAITELVTSLFGSD